uniref:Uncharacterized protein n=1 Tax=Sparus aurata TaxID=8175 RepID=A0A671TET4_SPAAU
TQCIKDTLNELRFKFKFNIKKESAFVLTVMTLTVLGPSGWIFAHLDDYKSRS